MVSLRRRVGGYFYLKHMVTETAEFDDILGLAVYVWVLTHVYDPVYDEILFCTCAREA